MRAGFNSGVLRHCGFNLIDTIHFVKKLGTNAFELSFFDSAMLLDFELDDEIIDLLNSFDYLSIHAPFDPSEGDKYRDDKFMGKIISKIETLALKLNVDGVIFHPSFIEDFDLLDSSSLSILFENMDYRKDSFRKLKSLTKIKNKYSFGFVLDIEHAFENDTSFGLTNELIELMGDRLKEIHLSGANSSDISKLGCHNHCQLGKSPFRKELLGVLKKTGDVPVILEVSAQKGEEGLLKDELEYVREVLG